MVYVASCAWSPRPEMASHTQVLLICLEWSMVMKWLCEKSYGLSINAKNCYLTDN